jgi:ATP-dependent DNA ligase
MPVRDTLRHAAGVRLYSRNCYDFSKRFPLIVAAIATLPARSCLIDGEAIVSDGSGLAVFNLLRFLADEPLGRALRPSTCSN